MGSGKSNRGVLQGANQRGEKETERGTRQAANSGRGLGVQDHFWGGRGTAGTPLWPCASPDSNPPVPVPEQGAVPAAAVPSLIGNRAPPSKGTVREMSPGPERGLGHGSAAAFKLEQTSKRCFVSPCAPPAALPVGTAPARPGFLLTGHPGSPGGEGKWGRI